MKIKYEPSVIEKDLFKERLSKEIARATTCWGPHRDDFHFMNKETSTDSRGDYHGRDLGVFGSRGEQREAVFALTLAELEVISQQVGHRPVLLLDDIWCNHLRRRESIYS